MLQTIAGAALGFALSLFLLAPSASFAKGVDHTLLATTPHFAFYSDFATNINDALIVAGAARNKGEPELFRPQPEQGDEEDRSCFAELAPSGQAGWNLAVDYYAKVISPTRWNSRQQYLLRVDLAGLGMDFDARARGFARIAQGFRITATPAYAACHWSLQDSKNRRWVDALKPLLSAHEAAMSKRLAELYQTPWHGLPIRVDLVSTAPPVGANTIIAPPHILLSSAIENRDALEIIHHEASHTLMRPEDPIKQALADAARKLDVELPRDLWHVVLFFTTGETMRDILSEAGEPEYTPYVYSHDLWSGHWGNFRTAIEATWPTYLNGKRTLAEAASDLLQALTEPDDT